MYLCNQEYDGMTDYRQEYDPLVAEYKSIVSDGFSLEDFREYNEILFSCHSCGIEGNSFSVDDTRALKEQGLGMIPQGKPLVEAFEILDHFRAYEEMVRTVDEPLTEDHIKHLHFLLTEHTIAYRHHGAVPGEYTDTDMCAGDTIFGDHEQLIAQVPKLLESTERAITNGSLHIMELVARFHAYFEYLHPFRDGNGRLGRLLVNKLLLRKQQPILIIPTDKRDEYLTCLRLFRKDTPEHLTQFFYKTSVLRMQQEIAEKHNMTTNFTAGFDFLGK